VLLPGYRAVLAFSAECRGRETPRAEATAVRGLTPGQVAVLTAPVEGAQPKAAEARPRRPVAVAQVRPAASSGPSSWNFAFDVYGAKGEQVVHFTSSVEGDVQRQISSDLIRRGFDEKQLRAIAGELGPLIQRVESAKTDAEKMAVASGAGATVFRRVIAALGLPSPF